MPFPAPREGESHDDFHSRCMSEEKEGIPDQDQRNAACFDAWRKKHGGEAPSDRARTSRGFEVQSQDGVGEVYLYDEIGAGWFGGITASDFRDELAKLKSAKTLNIYINSPGGDFFEAAAMHSQLVRHKARKVVYIDGLAASAASLVAMAGDERRMSSAGMLMIHEPWGGVIGTSKEMRGVADALDKVRDTLANEYVRASGGDRATILAQMEAETWFSAAESLEAGFVHDIDEALPIAASIVEAFDLSRFQYKHPPRAMPKGNPNALLIRPERDRRMKELGAQFMEMRSAAPNGLAGASGARME